MISNLHNTSPLLCGNRQVCTWKPLEETFVVGETFTGVTIAKAVFLKVQAITLDTSGCDSVTEQIDIGTNLLYDVLELWSGSQPNPINPSLECWSRFYKKSAR